MDLETTLVSGLSSCYSAVAETLGVLTVADVAMTAAYGLSSCYSAVVDLVATEVETAADVDATICAASW